MKAAIFSEFQGAISIQTVDDPSPSNDGVVVEVKATGLCRSDWHGWMGHDPDIKLPHIPGHELAGVVVEVGKHVQKVKVGDRVTTPFVCGCGTCPQCTSGNHQVCDHQSQPGFTHWGSFAEFVALDYADTNIVQLPEDIDFVTAATLGCRFITSFRAIVDQGKVQEDEFVVIHGCGGIGLSAIMIAKAFGAYVVGVDINNNSLELAKSVGADAVINAKNHPDLISHIREFTSGGAHVSMDALGSQETCFNSIANLRKRGRHLQVGLVTGNHQHPKIPMDRVIADELEIYGSHGMQAFKYPKMLKMISSGKLAPQKLIEKTITLEEATSILPTMNEFGHSGVIVIDRF